MKQQIEERSMYVNLLTPENGQSIEEYLADITAELTAIKRDNWTADTVCEKLYTRDYGYDGAFEIILEFCRLETDEEYESRLAQEREELEKSERKRLARLEKNRAKTAAKEAEERKEYERLRAKYGEVH